MTQSDPNDYIIGPPEHIPDSSRVFHRISSTGFPPGAKFAPNMIIQQGDDGISTEWDRHATLQGCASRGKAYDDVISFPVGSVRNITFTQAGLPPRLHVNHAPTYGTYAHSLIVRLVGSKGDRRTIRNALYGLARKELIRSTYDYSGIP